MERDNEDAFFALFGSPRGFGEMPAPCPRGPAGPRVGSGPVTDPLAAIAQLPGVAEAVDTAREAVDRLYRHRVLRRASPAVSTESSLRGARASAAIEGVDVPLEALRRDECTIRSSRALCARQPNWAGWGPPGVSRPGRCSPGCTPSPRRAWRTSRTWAAREPSRTSRTWAAREPSRIPWVWARRRPPAAARLESLFTLLSAPTKAPALVLAAVVHAELAVLRPFGTADGVVARAAERLTLVEYGLDPKSLVAVEVGHLDQPYAEGLRAYLTGTPEGVSHGYNSVPRRSRLVCARRRRSAKRCREADDIADGVSVGDAVCRRSHRVTKRAPLFVGSGQARHDAPPAAGRAWVPG